VPAGTGTDRIGLVLQNLTTSQSTPTIPFFVVKVSTIKPTVSKVGPIANSASPIKSVLVRFSEPIVSSSFTTSDIVLTRNGTPVSLSGLTITPASGSALSTGFTIGGLYSFSPQASSTSRRKTS